MLMLPICLATLPPSRPPSASPTAPVAFADSEPVTLSVPVSGVASDSTSCAPVAAIGPREAVQPISAFCRICDTGLSALPAKVARRAAIGGVADRRQRNRDRRHHGGARGAGGSGGNSTSAGGRIVARGASQSIAFRLTKNETATTASAIEIVFRCIGRRIVPPDSIECPRMFYRGGEGDATAHMRGVGSIQNGPGECRGRFSHYETLMVQRMVRPRSARRSVIGSTITLVPTLTRE